MYNSNNSVEELELSNCTFVTAVLMLLVVLSHSVHFWTDSWFSVISPAQQSECLNITAFVLRSFVVQAFTLISGYIFSYGKNEAGKYTDFAHFSKTKAKRLIVPFYFALIIWVLPINQYFYHEPFYNVLKNDLLGESPSQLWFLLMLFVVFIIAYFTSNVWNKGIFYGLCSCVICYCIGNVFRSAVGDIFQIATGLQYIVYFWIGYELRLSLNRKRIFFQIRKFPWFLWCIIEAALFFIYLINKTHVTNGNLFYKIGGMLLILLIGMIGSVAAFFTLQKIASIIKSWKTSTLFQFFRKRSMVVYLFHQQVIYFVLIEINGKVSPSVNVIINYVVALGVSLIIASVLMKFKVTRFLVGEK